MDYYIDIKLFPKKEIRENILLNHVYTAFHKRLFDLKSTNIAISFPEYKIKLGRLFRIHGTKEALEKMEEKEWIGKYKSFCLLSEIENIPDNVEYRTVSRIQQNMTESKLRRLINRGTIPEEDIKKYRIKMFQEGLDNPYVELVSMSNGQLHRRFIKFGELEEKAVYGEFDSFGLSKTSTIPWF